MVYEVTVTPNNYIVDVTGTEVLVTTVGIAGTPGSMADLKLLPGWDNSGTKKQVLCAINGILIWKTAKKCDGTDA